MTERIDIAWLKARGDSPTYRTLSSIVAWSAATPKDQDAAVKDVGRRLGEDWQHVETLTRVLEGFGLRTATFLHKPTGLRFQLVPGALFKQIWWANPEVAFVHSMLLTLSYCPDAERTPSQRLHEPHSCP